MTALPFARSHAVVVGINGYQHGIPALRTAVADATRIGDVLARDHGYEVRRLLDGEASLATLTGLLTRDLARDVGPDDRVLLYFAGHGVALEGEDGPRGYLLPADARAGDSASFVSMTLVHDALLALPCRHLLLVLDCCFAGAFRWSATRDVGRDEVDTVHRQRFDRFVQDPAWQVLTSAAHDQKALDILTTGSLGMREESGTHSPFALAFLEALAGDADLVPRPDGDGLLTATELYLYLEDKVQPGALETGHRQTPGLWPLRRHGKGEFVFLIPGRPLALPEAPPLNLALNPYRGLSSYDREHKDTFFGRDRVVAALRERVEAQQLLVVLGASGTGKSSVVKAGLVPALEAVPGGRFHVLPVLRPGAHPLAALTQACLALAPAGEQDPVRAVRDWCTANAARHPVLVVDQFEELTTLCTSLAERDAALALVHQLLEACPALRVVVTLRTDFEPQLASGILSRRWAAGRYVVPPVSQGELRQIIEGPASRAVMYFDPGTLVDQLIDEVVQTPGGLPLLSFTLSEMYVRSVKAARGDRALSRLDYTALGGVVGALRHAANEVFDGLDTAHRATMERVMLRMVSATGGNVARRRVALAELEYDEGVLPGENARVRHVLDTLVGARLVVRGSDADGQPFAEPAHDALVNAWDLLITWIHAANQRGPALAMRERLARVADDWSRAGSAEGSALLWKDSSRAAQLRGLLRGKADWLNARERRFAQRSVRGWRVGLAIAAGVVLAIAAGGIAATVFGMDARRQGLQAQRAAAQADSAAKQAQANAVAALARSADDPVVRAQLLGEIVELGLPSPTSGTALVMETMRALDSGLVPWTIGVGWGYAEGRNEDGTTAGILMTTALDRLYAGGVEVSRYDFQRVGAPEAAAIDPMPRDEYEQPWGAAAAFEDHVVQYTSGSRSGAKPRRLGAHAARVNRLVFSDNGLWVVSSSDDGTARRWSVEGDTAAVMDAGDGAVVDVAVSYDGALVATAHASGTSRVWQVQGTVAREVARITGEHLPTTIAISPSGEVVATGDTTGLITVWEAATGRQRRTIKRGAGIDALALTRDGAGVLSLAGERVSTARADAPSVPLTRTLTRVGARDYGYAMPGYRPQFAAGRPRPRIVMEGSGKRALVVGPNAQLWYWPVILPAPLPPASAPVAAAAQGGAGWSARPDSGRVVVVGPGGTPRLTLSPQGSLGREEGIETHYQFAADHAAVAVWHRGAGQWNLSAYALPDGGKIFDMGSAGELNCLAFAPRATHIAWCPTRFTPEIIPLPPVMDKLVGDGGRVTLPVPSAPVADTTGFGFQFVRGAAFSPDGGSVLLWGDYHDAVVARADGTGSPIYVMGPGGGIVEASFSADGRRVRLVSGSGRAIEVPIDFTEAARALGTRVRSCLTAAQRVQYLSESDSVSTARSVTCELRHWTTR